MYIYVNKYVIDIWNIYNEYIWIDCQDHWFKDRNTLR